MGQRTPRPLASSHCLLSPLLQCDDVVCGLSPSLATLGELKPPQRQNLTAFLQLVGCSVQGGRLGLEGAGSNQQLFSTAYFLVSALAGTDRASESAVALKLLCSLRREVGAYVPPFQQRGRMRSGGQWMVTGLP